MVHDDQRRNPSTAVVQRVAAELDMPEREVHFALRTLHVEHQPSLIDETFGPARLTVSKPLHSSPSAARRKAQSALRKHQLSPVGGVWLQDRGTWPDPNAESAVARVSVWVDDVTIRVVADLVMARRGYLAAAVATLSLLPLFMLASGIFSGALFGSLASIGAVGGLAADYRKRLSIVERNLRTFAETIAQPVMPPSVIG
ncbi:MAG: hypothetical protein HKN07_06040 [Acidimicrobiia bacterium]|nr:hypothetical protein [Acidimicrobiia bacterium]